MTEKEKSHGNNDLSTKDVTQTKKDVKSSVNVSKDLILRKLFQMMVENLDEFVYYPIPKNIEYIRCQLTRDKQGLNKHFLPNYYLHAERNDGKKYLILAARHKLRKYGTANYVIGTDITNIVKDEEPFIGRFRGNNMIDSEFIVYDNGVNPKHVKHNQEQNQRRRQMAAIVYV
ncbi:unnamed protein product [Didymodactylos carnosus]|uniref:Tubby C-terminal domain-containing protein n=1 Tax=Didymodactylos carnosus TaxID=1234261 RepID=A0A815R1C2_9BILA|nr:unnamed protein product [Didymodactylos carnosus]CAF1469244.1 unnamed protein product [Didymodactylos carnosus]CAF3868085.1 unnamed protein product [Didymodactylos carnosus]CAF4337555.1 unnamed protein product [Didymodactylos carnosus]